MGYLQTLTYKFGNEPIRFVPATAWVAYMYILFVSDGILPGANALAVEHLTWEEVRDLSINFFLISPAPHLPFSPVVHPMLEGVFNLLLAWAALFAGFLSDERVEEAELVTVRSDANWDAIPLVRFFITLPVHEDIQEKD